MATLAPSPDRSTETLLGAGPDRITPAEVGFDPAATGIGDSETVDAVALVLSRLCCVGHRRPPGTGLPQLARVLGHQVRTALPGNPAPLPEYDHLEGGAAMLKASKRISRLISRTGAPITPKAIRFYWQSFEVIDADQAERCLPLELLAAVFPEPRWQSIAAVLVDGPSLTKKRLNLWLLTAASQTNLRKATLTDYGYAIKRLTNDCVALRDAHPAFEHWTESPEPTIPSDANKAPQRRDEAPKRVIRLAMKELRAGVCRRLRCEEGKELERIKALTPSQLRHSNVFRELRGWAMLNLLFITASRIEAVTELTVDQYRDSFRSGYGVAPTILLEPNKTWEDGDISPKPLGGQGAYPLDLLLAYREKLMGHAPPGDAPLFPAGLNARAQMRPWGPDAVRQFLAGEKVLPRHATSVAPTVEKRLALIERARANEEKLAKAEAREPRTSGWLAARGGRRRHRIFFDEEGLVGKVKAALPFDPEKDPFAGWGPHSLRKTATQLLDNGDVENWLAREKSHLNLKTEYLSEVLADHRMEERSVEEKYKLTHERAELHAGIATEYLSALLYTNLGATMVQDVGRYEQALRSRKAVRSQEARLSDRRHQLREQLRRGEISADDYLRENDQVVERLGDLRSKREAMDREIAAIESDEERYRIPLPDSEPESAKLEIPARLEAARVTVDGRAEPADRPRLERLRDWLTLLEFARVAGVSANQVRKWAKGLSLPRGVRPWESERVPVDESLGPRRKRILVDLISEPWLMGAPGRRDLVEDLLTDWPAEANWHHHRQATAERPEWADEDG